MGFSPGDFETANRGKVHFETKRDSVIVLWNEHESEVLLEVDVENAHKMIDNLRICLHTLGEEE